MSNKIKQRISLHLRHNIADVISMRRLEKKREESERDYSR